MDVKITSALMEQLKADGLDYLEFIESFRDWKSGNEFGSYYFGKDGTYETPRVNDERRLWHVHLVPILDENQLSLWDRVWKRKGQKTSDRALVYTKDNLGNHLLIFILAEPYAHETAKMKTVFHREIMEGFAAVAEDFIYNGIVA